ncbi:DNA ligase 4 [Mercurialis annua]|uniref:DNA ligase 4 n=1 Tax=Mercurialis annua TaxID=3986 RepID=UPI00215E30BC|nr:DNA ligase 4 [Mercurialis annua]
MTGETKFSVLVSLFEWIQKTKNSAKKRSKFRKFLDTFCKSDDYFSAIRLILPSLDRERGSYGLKESVLATSLVDALSMSRESPDAVRLFNWRKGGPKTGSNAGNFPLVAFEVLQRRQGLSSGGLTIKELNELLDSLASSENRAEKVSVLSTLINKTNAQEMKWIIMIILKDLKLGISEKSIFKEFHPDAEDLFNVTCDLKLVCEKLKDRSQRHKRQDIEVGKAVRPQLAMRVSDANSAWKKLHGKEVVVECKFDGDRIQIHKNGADVHYFSRNFLDHSEYGHGMSDIIIQSVLADKCILDGEMLVWDPSLNRFAEFGSNQEIAKAAKDGLDSGRQLCYVAFDILYVGDTSVIHQSLRERQDLLRKFVRPIKGRLEILVPDGGLNDHRLPGEPPCSLVAYNVNDVKRFFEETVKNRDEGIILKDLASKWDPSDRSGKWLKLKPEYIQAASDLDVLIIGGYYGSGRRGGEVAQFLVGLAERPAPDTYPKRFISFCRVGTGLTDDELAAVVSKLKPYFRKYEYPKMAPPSFYQVTNNSKERPDVWIESPDKSIIVSITSDIRTISSEVFAAPYSLRFPRIDRVRYDKPWHECLDVQSFVELVLTSNGTTQKTKDNEVLQDRKLASVKSSRKGGRKNLSAVPSHFIETDVSNVKGDTLIFSKLMFYFVNVPPTQSLESFHKMVAENGGTFSMNLNKSVTHCVAAESKGIKYQAAKLHGDIIHFSWVLDCCSQRKLLPLQPKYFLFLSDSTKRKLQEEIDEYSDSYYWDIDLADMKQLLESINISENSHSIAYLKRKYVSEDKWSLFYGCSVYFYLSAESVLRSSDWQSLFGIKLKRFKLEVMMGGGQVTNNLVNATHLVVLTVPGANVDFDYLTKSFTVSEKHLLRNKKLHVIGYRWLEDSLEKQKKLQEDAFSLKPFGLQESNIEDWKCNLDMEDASGNVHVIGNQEHSPSSGSKKKDTGDRSVEQDTILSSPKRDAKRKRGRPASKNTKKAKVGPSRARRTQARVRKPVKICDDVSDGSSSSDNKENEEIHIEKGRSDIKESGVECFGSSPIHNIAEEEAIEGNKQEECIDKASCSETVERHQERDDRSGKTPYSETGGRYDVEDKLEVMVDPVQAMLIDMIPSLSMKKNVEISSQILNSEKPSEEPNMQSQSVKKKKVSYKDLANQLLKE